MHALERRGVDAWTISRRPSGDHRALKEIALEEGAWDSPALERVLEDVAPDCIVHLAGKSKAPPAELAAVNLGLIQRLLEALRGAGLRPRLVVAGSAAEYGAAIRDGEAVCETAACAPLSDYGATKLAQTRAVLAYAEATGTSALVARIFNPIGPGMPPHLAIADFARQIWSMPKSGGLLRVGDIDVRRDMMDVEHVAALLCDLAENEGACGVVNLCSGRAQRLRDLVEMLIEGSGRRIAIEIDPARLRGNEPRAIVGSVDRLAQQLGRPPPPTDFPAVIARVCRSMDESRAPQS